jgi:hypothetical protein
MEWVVSLETAGDPAVRFGGDIRRLATALHDVPAAVELREHGYGTTVLVDCEDPQEALSRGLRTLRAAEERVGIAGLPVVSAEVTAARELPEARVPPRSADLDEVGRALDGSPDSRHLGRS